jgi:murein DD-endopeptidase MepM/ murein hydrolase activator NlpD
MTLAGLLQAALSLLPLPAAPPPAGAPPASGRAAAAVAPGPAGVVRSGWTPPLAGPLVVLDPFRPPAQDWMPGHRGVDLDARPGDEVRAAADGLVLWAGDLAGRGVVSVLHGDGRRTTYEPLLASVAIGDEVSAGQVLGRLATGASHCGGVASCLHWGLRRGDAYLDPMALLGPSGRPRLLPLGAGAVP